MSSPIVAAFLQSAVFPALAATVSLFFLGGLKDPPRARLQGLALALAYVVGAYMLLARLHFPPHDAPETFSWAALFLAVFVIVNPRPLGPRYLVRGLFVLGLGIILLWPIRQNILQPIHYRNLVAFFCLGLGVWSIVEGSAAKVRMPTLCLLPLISLTAVSVLLLFSASASFSQLATILCALIAGMTILAWRWPRRLSTATLLPFVSVFVIFFIAAGHFYLDINPWRMIGMCWPFLLLWIRDWLVFVPKSVVPEAIIMGLLAVLPLAYWLYGVSVATGPLY